MSKHIEDMRVLFVCKNRLSTYKNSVGLVNSASFVARKLEELGAASQVVSVQDANFIDKEVHSYKPTHVIIEALWVTWDKLEILLKKYPQISWVIRVHSKIPFIANEGIAFSRLLEYKEKLQSKYANLYLSANSISFIEDVNKTVDMNCLYTPNIYDPDDIIHVPYKHERDRNPKVLDVGVFGAIRPMKNILKQAIAAIEFANKEKKILHFHVNAGRLEQAGEQTLKNLISLFNGTGKHSLVQHDWLCYSDFIYELSKMDICMQVSMSETFSITAADSICLGIPTIASKEVEIVSSIFQADFNNTDDIVDKLNLANDLGQFGSWLNLKRLQASCKDATDEWVRFLKKTY